MKNQIKTKKKTDLHNSSAWEIEKEAASESERGRWGRDTVWLDEKERANPMWYAKSLHTHITLSKWRRKLNELNWWLWQRIGHRPNWRETNSNFNSIKFRASNESSRSTAARYTEIHASTARINERYVLIWYKTLSYIGLETQKHNKKSKQKIMRDLNSRGSRKPNRFYMWLYTRATNE